VADLTRLVESLSVSSTPALDPRTAGARAVIQGERVRRERLQARENWVREHLPELVDELGADPWATWAIAELERDGLEVTAPAVRRLRAARVAALDA
jgi:hypothetical protein